MINKEQLEEKLQEYNNQVAYLTSKAEEFQRMAVANKGAAEAIQILLNDISEDIKSSDLTDNVSDR